MFGRNRLYYSFVPGVTMDDYGMLDTPRLPEDLEARIRSEIGEGEKLIWTGQPNPSRAGRYSFIVVLFGIVFTGFALFWIMSAAGMMFFAGNNFPGEFGLGFGCFPLCGLPFVVVGVFMLTAPIWIKRRAAKTCYALTDRRALTWVPGWFGSVEVRSYGPDQLQKLLRTEYADGGGDLVFEEVFTRSTDSDGHWQTHRTRYGFLAIDRVRAVEDLLRKTLLSGEGR